MILNDHSPVSDGSQLLLKVDGHNKEFEEKKHKFF